VNVRRERDTSRLNMPLRYVKNLGATVSRPLS